MATALQQQLAAIAANSTHQLDLKAQKARHSKSLLFEPRDASTQSFDTIYQICYEGFEELCMLDSRFAAFGQNLFSEQSKSEDRTQMTAKENEELDKMVETFLGLICGRLLLKPAIKAVEWLVRRFRVQEYNIECMLLTFLPYHTSHIFPTLLSILPDQLPTSFRFLHPYVASLQCPPRHAILSAAIQNEGFFSAFSHFVLRVAKARHQSAILIGFWASITAQAVNGMIDTSQSGRDSIRKQRQEDLLLRVLPILQSALSIKAIPELYLGACMIMTILATKASLEDKALDAMLEAVANAWTEDTLAEGLTCLSIIAEEKQHVSIPPSTTRALLRAEQTFPLLVELNQSQRISKLVTALASGAVTQGCKKDNVQHIGLVSALLGANILPDSCTVSILEKLMTASTKLRNSDLAGDVSKAITGLLTTFSDESEHARRLSQAASNTHIDLQTLQILPIEMQTDASTEVDAVMIDRPGTEERDPNATSHTESLYEKLPQLAEEPFSFLEPDATRYFQPYANVFHSVLASRSAMQAFLALSQLQRNQYIERPEFFTFLARVWTGDTTTIVKVCALDLAREQLGSKDAETRLDLQALLPYVFLALNESSPKVRKAGADLCRRIHNLFESERKATDSISLRICPVTNIYGASIPRTHWLRSDEAQKFLTNAVIPMLDDTVLDGSYLLRALVEMLNHGNVGENKLHSLLRTDVCTFMAVHAVSTPVMRVRLLLLQVLSRAGRTGSQARSKVLLPFIKEWLAEPLESLTSVCRAEKIDLLQMDRAVLGNLTHRSTDEVALLRNIALGEIPVRNELIPAAFERLRHAFNAATSLQMALVDFLLELAVKIPQGESARIAQDEALETLRGLPIPTGILGHMLDMLPNGTALQDQPPPGKKQRTSSAVSSQPRVVDQSKMQAEIRHITYVLEIIEASKAENQSTLLRGLFHTLSTLHHYKTLMGSELVYLHQMLLGCILTIVDSLRATPHADVDSSIVRTDLIVECVRTTTSTQVHNTALLLVSSLASWTPELVLHNVMPLFTFMSSTLLRQNDAFSAHVTDQVVSRIIPPLAKSLKNKGKNLVSGVAELLLSFTAAFEHIPLHRRAGLFEHLVETLGPDETLFAVMAMLHDRYPSDPSISVFVANLTNRFSLVVAIKAASQYVDLVFDVNKPKRGLSEILLLLSDKGSDEVEESTVNLLEKLATVLQDTGLRKRLVRELATEEAGASDIQAAYASLLEKSMQLTRELGSRSVLKGPANGVLLSVLGLMPTSDFIQSSAQLMQTGSDETRQQVFHSLEERVNQAKRMDTASRQIFLDVLSNCGVFIREDQPIATIHAATSCIDQISEKYGKTERSAVLKVAEQVAGSAALGSSDHSLRTISILCLASMTEVLGDSFIPILPNVLIQTIGYLEDNVSAASLDVEIQRAGFSLFNAILDHLPWILTEQYLDRALMLACQTSCIQKEQQIDDHLTQGFGDLAATKVAPPQLFAAIERIWREVSDLGEEAIHYHLNTLHQAVKHNSKATITKNARTSFNILLEAFDLRRHIQQLDGKDDNDDHSELFQLVDKIALDATLQLNDAAFRPFFTRLMEWATNGLPKKDATGRTLRTISLYSFSLALFDQLKSIVTSYSSYILEDASKQLQSLSTGAYFDRQLLDLVLQTLSSSFQNDQDDFWQTPSHFEAISLPLISQLKKAKQLRIEDQVIPAITSLAAAAVSPEHHKTINTAIMSYMRDEQASVRLAAVMCERSITERVNFEWLSLLPEMLPFISELQEDDDEEVERETLRWVKQIEDITGESLEGMLA